MNMYFMYFFQLYNYFEDSNYVYLVLEMCHNGEMSRYLRERKMPFSEDEGQNHLLKAIVAVSFVKWCTHNLIYDLGRLK